MHPLHPWESDREKTIDVVQLGWVTGKPVLGGQLHTAVVGGGDLEASVREFWARAVNGLNIVNGYGSTG